MIIDTHLHLPVGKGYFSLDEKKKQLLCEMNANKIDYSIVISDSCLESEIGSLDECVKLFEDTNNIFVIGGIGPDIEFEKQFRKLERYLSQNLILGIKLFTGHELFYLTDERLNRIYDLAIKYDVPVLFHSGWNNPQYSDAEVVIEVAKNHPNLKFDCCHCFYPDIKKTWQLIEYPNVYFDISSVAHNKNLIDKITFEISNLIKAAPERVIFGSDYSGCSQEEHLQLIKNFGLCKEIEKKILYENAANLYGLNL